MAAARKIHTCHRYVLDDPILTEEILGGYQEVVFVEIWIRPGDEDDPVEWSWLFQNNRGAGMYPNNPHPLIEALRLQLRPLED